MLQDEQRADAPVASDDHPLTGLSGDPLLKRLVELAQLGWSARLTMVTNGAVLSGILISPKTYRAALAQSIRGRPPGGLYEMLDSLIASAIDMDDPGPTDLGPADLPEPRFIHLADVSLDGRTLAPYLRLRLPAVSGFWLDPVEDHPNEAGSS